MGNGGLPRTWEVLPSPPDPAALARGSPQPKNSRPTSVASWGGGREVQGAARGTAKRRQRSAAGRAAGSRSASIGPRKRGHGTRPDHGEGSEASDGGPVGGKDGEGIDIRVPCQRNNNG